MAVIRRRRKRRRRRRRAYRLMRARVFHPRINPLEGLDDDAIFARYRFRLATIQFILNLIGENLQYKTKRNSALSPMVQLLIALRFFANNSFHLLMGDTFRVSKATAGRCIRRVVDALCHYKEFFINFPHIPRDVDFVREGFFKLAGLY